jgi:hypothetical protein
MVFRERGHQMILRERIQVVLRCPHVREMHLSVVVETCGVKDATGRMPTFPIDRLREFASEQCHTGIAITA